VEKRLDKIEEKLDKVLEEVSSINVTMARNTADLEYHIKRTDLLEDQFKPIHTAYNRAEGIFKAIGVIGTVVGLVFAGIKAIEIVSSLL
jgi:tetrahydromethanopterin S-methyltransferase subunit G